MTGCFATVAIPCKLKKNKFVVGWKSTVQEIKCSGSESMERGTVSILGGTEEPQE